MDSTSNLSPCVVCGNNVTADCRCRLCDGRLHSFCGVAEGLEGHGPKYLCSADCCGISAPLLPAWDDATTFALLSENENSLLPDASDAMSAVGEVVMEDGTQ
jgi:hypothetical protein